MAIPRRTSRWWLCRFHFACAMVAAYQALTYSTHRSLLMICSTCISVTDMVSFVLVADGINVVSTRMCRKCGVGLPVVISRSSVGELPISSCQSRLRLRCLRRFPSGRSTYFSYSTADSSFWVLGFETKYAILGRRNATDSTRRCASFIGLGTRSPVP